MGRALAASAVPRKELFLTTKLWRDSFEPDRVRPSAEGSLEKLQVNCVDLLLLHWPNDDVPLEQTLRALAELREDGADQALRRLQLPARACSTTRSRSRRSSPTRSSSIPTWTSRRWSTARSRRTSWSPPTLRSREARCLRTTTLRGIGEQYDKTAGQVALRWLLDKPNVATIPKASSHERRVENFEVFDFKLSDDDRAQIDALHSGDRIIDPRWAPDWGA